MNANPLVFENTLDLACPRAERLNASDRLILAITTVGIVAATVAYITYDITLRQQLRPDEFFAANMVKPPLYYAAHGAQMVLLIAAGLLALITTQVRQIERGYFLRFALLIGAAMLTALRGYAPADYLSTKIVDGTGPLPIFISLLVFVGAKRSNWVVLEKIMIGIAVLFSCLAIYRMAGLQTFTRQEGVANLAYSLNAMFWPGAWIALRTYEPGSFTNRIKFIPTVIYALGSLFTQTRLNFVMVLSVFAIYAILQRKRRAPQTGLWIGMAALAVWVALFAGVFLRTSRGLDRLQTVTSAFGERIDEDTRTEQVTAFFESVAPSELVLGRGSMGTWDWDGYEWRGGTDIGYLSILFYGGIPLLLTYIATHVEPCISALFRYVPDWRLAGAGVGVLWAIRMFSSSYPGTSLEYYCILFCIGAAISRESYA